MEEGCVGHRRETLGRWWWGAVNTVRRRVRPDLPLISRWQRPVHLGIQGPVRGFLTLFLCLILSACAVKRGAYDVPDIPLPDRFKHAPDVALPFKANGIRLQHLSEELAGLTLVDEVLFDFDKSAIREEAYPALDQLVEVLERYDATLVRVVGHTDAIGSDAYNQGLSERRAQAVVDYLTRAGIEATRLTAQGEGESEPRASNQDPAGRQRNRRVEVDVPGTDAGPEGTARPIMALDSVLAEWWRLLDDAQLNRLVDRALANNHDMRVSALQVIQASARADQAVSEKWPVITAPVRAEGESPENGIGTVRRGDDPQTRHTYQASIRGDWRVDLWGELESQAQSADLELWRAAFRHDETRRQVVTGLVTTYLEYLSLNDRLRVAKETHEVLGEMLDAMRQRLEKGDATITDVEQQKAVVHAVEATIPQLKLRRQRLHNRIALLTGGTPTDLDLSDSGLDSISLPRVITGVPSVLVLRRPDVRAVEARLLRADADIDLARARLLPPLDLTAQVGYGSRYLSQLFDSHTLFWNAIANLSITLFDKGKRDRQVDYARAVHEEMVETYVRTIYNAVVEVEDALTGIEYTGRRLAIQQRATDAARRGWQLSRESYRAGGIDYLALLDTQRTYHRNLDELHRVRMERSRALADLFGSLGGGVEKREPIPGKGKRPVPSPWERHGIVLAGEPLLPSSPGWKGVKEGTGSGVRWLVELSGLYDRDGVDTAWRDLEARLGEDLEDYRLLLIPAETAPQGETPRSDWHRLFIGGMDSVKEADSLCQSLYAARLRCRVVTERLVDFHEKSQAWPSVASGAEPFEAEALRSKTPSDNKADPQAKPDAAGFAVQIGSYLNERYAKDVLEEWRAKGYDAYLSRIKGGPKGVWQTVRVGWFAQEDEAAMRAREIRRHEGAVVVTVPAKNHAASRHGSSSVKTGSPQRISTDRGYAVQVGTYENDRNAKQVVEQWREEGYAAYIYPVQRPKGEPWRTVRIGVHENKMEARKAAGRILAKEGRDVSVVPVRVERIAATGRSRP